MSSRSNLERIRPLRRSRRAAETDTDDGDSAGRAPSGGAHPRDISSAPSARCHLDAGPPSRRHAPPHPASGSRRLVELLVAPLKDGLSRRSDGSRRNEGAQPRNGQPRPGAPNPKAVSKRTQSRAIAPGPSAKPTRIRSKRHEPSLAGRPRRRRPGHRAPAPHPDGAHPRLQGDESPAPPPRTSLLRHRLLAPGSASSASRTRP